VFLFSKGRSSGISYHELFHQNRQYIFSIFAMFFVINILISVLLNRFEIEFQENIARILGIGLSALAFRIENHRFHQSLAVASALLLLINAYFNSPF